MSHVSSKANHNLCVFVAPTLVNDEGFTETGADEKFVATEDEPGQKKGTQSSLVVIFSVWKTMTGTALVSLPWAFQ